MDLSQSSADGKRRPRIQHLIFALIGGVLALRHLQIFHEGGRITHLELLTSTFSRMDEGRAWVAGEQLGNTGLFLGGPLYAWLSYPARLADNPALGIHLCYFALELICIGAWFYWPTGKALPRAERWVAALVLALLFEVKVEVVQNDTIMAMLLIPLFASFLWALDRPGWRRMAVPGVLAGCAICVHQSSVAVLPVLLVGLLLRREQLLARALAGLGGVMAVFVVIAAPSVLQSLWPLELAPAAFQDNDVPTGEAAVPLGMLFRRLVNLVSAPLATVGLLLAGGQWIRRKAQPAGHRFAVIWLLGVGLFYSLAFTMRGELLAESQSMLGSRDIRFAPLGPARAALSAVFLGWIFGHARAWLARRSYRAPSPAMLMVAACLVAISALGLVVGRAAERHEKEWQTSSRQACAADIFNRDLRPTWLAHRLYSELSRDPVVLASRVIGVPRIFLNQDLEFLAHWANKSPPRRAGQNERPRLTVLLPQIRGAGLSRLKGARAHGPTRVVPGAMLLARVQEGHPALSQGQKLKVSLPEALKPGRRRWLLLASHADQDPGLRLRVETPSGAVLVEPTSGCGPAEQPGAAFRWQLFDLHALPGGASQIWMTTRRTALPSLEVFALLLPAAASG